MTVVVIVDGCGDLREQEKRGEKGGLYQGGRLAATLERGARNRRPLPPTNHHPS